MKERLSFSLTLRLSFYSYTPWWALQTWRKAFRAFGYLANLKERACSSTTELKASLDLGEILFSSFPKTDCVSSWFKPLLPMHVCVCVYLSVCLSFRSELNTANWIKLQIHVFTKTTWRQRIGWVAVECTRRENNVGSLFRSLSSAYLKVCLCTTQCVCVCALNREK